MAKPKERLHPLEAQFDLPTASIEAQDFVGRRLLRQAGPNQEELRALATLFGNFFLFFVGLKLHLPDHVPGGRCAPSDCNEASPDSISLGRQYPAGQVLGLAHLQTAERGQDIHPATVFVKQRQRLPIEPKQDVTASLHYMRYRGPGFLDTRLA